MPILDQFLLALTKKGASEFLLKPAHRPHFAMPDGTEQPLTRVLSARDVLHIVNELLPAGEKLEEKKLRDLTIPYSLADGSRYFVSVKRDVDSFFVSCRSEASAKAALEAKAAPPPSTPSEAPEKLSVTVEPPPKLTMDFLFQLMKDIRASDLHYSSDAVPMMRIDGEMTELDGIPPLQDAQLLQLLKPIVPARNMKEFEEVADTDFAYELKDVGRFRANLFRDRKGVGSVFRIIPERIVTTEELGLSPRIQALCQLKKGLVLVTGPTGSGKSTTLAAMVDLVNRTRREHVITIEDPIEFVHENKKCLMNQREVNVHTQGFKRALRAALREDPDVVLVGEMRDLETIAIAIETAVTGHLVFGTLHTSGAASTVDRIIDQFPPNQQSQIRVMLSDSLRGVISQILLRKKGGGRVAAMEVMIATPSISNLIREGKTFQIPSVMQTSRGVGMVTMSDALLELVKAGTVEVAEAYRSAPDKETLLGTLKRNNIEFTPRD